MTTVRSGASKIKIGDAAVVAHLDQISSGAASSFIARAKKELEGIKTSAMQRWPRRTGKSANSFVVGSHVTPSEIKVQLTNTSGYAFYVRWSVRSKEGIDAQIERAAARGLTGATQATLRAREQRRLWRWHGKGAPTDKLAGKSAWITLIRRPAKTALKALIPELQADLIKIAGR